MSRSSSPSRRSAKPIPEPESSPIDRAKVSTEMREIFNVVKQLQSQKDGLISQLESMELTSHKNNLRFCKEIGKVCRDVDGMNEILATATDSINAKTSYGIPEVPEAAVATLIPESLQDVMKGESSLDLGPESVDVQGAVAQVSSSAGTSSGEYIALAEASRNLIWDVERLNMIIQAYDKDLAKLKGEGGTMKSRVNALRLMWRSKFSALRRWQDWTRRSHVGRFQDQLDQAQAQFEAMQSDKEEDISALWELIGAVRIKENRVKLTLFLKMMKNAKLNTIWRSWGKFMNKRKLEAMNVDKDSLFDEHALKMSGKKREEVEAMLKTFLKRMKARKYVPAFNAWLELVGGRKKRSFEENLELERQRRMAAMADMEKNAMAQRLKIHFARLTGKMVEMCWRGWRKFVQDETLRKMADSEKFKRLKTFLGAKLKGLKYAVFHGLVREAKDNKRVAMMNSDKAKKVACYLEMVIRGIVQRIFGAMKRYRFMAKQQRAEEDRLRALFAEKNSQSMQRLRIFLAGKEKRMMYAGFRWWQNCTVNSKFRIMEREVEKARKARIAAEEECKRLRDALSSDAGRQGAKGKLEGAIAQMAQADAEAVDLTNQINEARAKLAALKEDVATVKSGRRDDKLETARLQKELEHVRNDKSELERELAMISDQIGFLSEYSAKTAK